METIADILMVAGALAAGFYCLVLSRKLSEFKSAENGIGTAVSELSAQVDELSASVASARDAAHSSSVRVTEMTERAESVAQRLELMIASMHDIPNGTPSEEHDQQLVFATRMSRASK